MSWEHLSKDEKKYLRRIIKLGESAGRRLQKFSKELHNQAQESLRVIKKIRRGKL